MKPSNKYPITINFSHVRTTRFYYRNQWGQTRPELPDKNIFTVHGLERHKLELVYGMSSYTMYEMALEKEILDVWIPTLYVEFSGHKSLTFTSDKAKALHKAWQAYLQNKTKKFYE